MTGGTVMTLNIFAIIAKNPTLAFSAFSRQLLFVFTDLFTAVSVISLVPPEVKGHRTGAGVTSYCGSDIVYFNL